MLNPENLKKRMTEVISLVESDISSIRTGRATPALLEDLKVKVYGGQQVLGINELATISASDASTLVIDPWDKSVIGEIRQGILAANIGMNPSIDGEIIRISFPPLTTEDREKYVKLLSQKIESGRVMIRQVRGEAMHKVKTSFEKKEIGEDEKRNFEKKIQESTDLFNEKLDHIEKRKKEELLTI